MKKITKTMLALSLSGVMTFGALTTAGLPVGAVGNGPNYNGNESIQTSILTTYEELVDYLEKQEQRQQAMELEVIGETVKGRDIYMAKYISNEENPTILFLTQQHGNEQLTTEGAMEFIKHLGTGKTSSVLDNVNILIIPMLNADGAMGDVNFSTDNYIASGDRHLTRTNANNIDLNREHNKPIDEMEPEARALYENVFEKYEIDYLIDLHHQGTQSERDGKLVSGSILYPTNPNVDPAIVEDSKKLGAVVFHEIESKGWGHLGKYNGGSGDNIGRNGIALRYDIATLLFEMRGMSDHTNPTAVLGQKSNGYLIRQTVNTLDSTVKAIADGSIDTVDTSFWETLPFQTTRPSNEE
ncbi:M14 family zinc carboxypeptidase [Alkalihalophilus pseudofirmus]|uniref:M14 family zinc carboxypeptidase n=1 Tax=Alkalihalophilus pseudofirmus TaxID=79885 RepID=UPI00259AEBE1|nr:M14 family zinc carboxypeptidase [Alkalihalophilus pseudofirmus]WEG15352.1 M14 family zinc carboxypeptidase [Alkalihalophilus pseudofirmus]